MKKPTVILALLIVAVFAGSAMADCVGTTDTSFANAPQDVIPQGQQGVAQQQSTIVYPSAPSQSLAMNEDFGSHSFFPDGVAEQQSTTLYPSAPLRSLAMSEDFSRHSYFPDGVPEQQSQWGYSHSIMAANSPSGHNEVPGQEGC